MDIASQLSLGDVGAVDGTQAFSGGGWVLLREKVGGSGTGYGSLFSRMRDTATKERRGWELYQREHRLIFVLAHTAGRQAIELTTSEKVMRPLRLF